MEYEKTRRFKIAAIENYYTDGPFGPKIMRPYRDKAYDAMYVLYDRLLSDEKFVSQVSCGKNSRQNLFDMFAEKVEQLCIQEFIDLDKGTEGMEVYNMLCSDKKFEYLWLTDLFNRVVNDINKQ